MGWAAPALNVLMHMAEPFFAMLVKLIWLAAFFKKAYIWVQVIFDVIS